MSARKNKALRIQERGNAFLIILLGVALFATMAIVLSRGIRSDTTGNLSDKQIDLAATEILDFSQKVTRAVDRILRRGKCGEGDISFHAAEWGHTSFEHGVPQPNTCRVFQPGDGNVLFQHPEADWLDATHTAEPLYGDYHFGGRTCVPGVGTGGSGCAGDADSSNEEMVVTLHYLEKDVCLEINKRLGIPEIAGDAPVDLGCGNSTAVFYTGSFQDGDAINPATNDFDGKYSGCFKSLSANCVGQPDHYIFYSVLIAR